MRISQNQEKTDIICCICGNIKSIQRSEARKLQIFKTLDSYCFMCQKETKHIYIKDIRTVKLILEEIEQKYTYLKPKQQLVLNLIDNKKNKIK